MPLCEMWRGMPFLGDRNGPHKHTLSWDHRCGHVFTQTFVTDFLPACAGPGLNYVLNPMWSSRLAQPHPTGAPWKGETDVECDRSQRVMVVIYRQMLAGKTGCY